MEGRSRWLTKRRQAGRGGLGLQAQLLRKLRQEGLLPSSVRLPGHIVRPRLHLPGAPTLFPMDGPTPVQAM